MLKLPRFKAAAVQASPAYLDASATADKAASLVREAAANGAHSSRGDAGCHVVLGVNERSPVSLGYQ